MRRRVLAPTLLALVILALPAIGVPDGERNSESLSLSAIWEGLVEWVSGLAAGESTSAGPLEDDSVGPIADPNGANDTEPAPPESEVGPWIDPNG